MSKRKLLLADDSVTIQKVINLTFADEGIEVVTCGDGDTALEKIASESPDLVMADVHMPGANGYSICESIRSNPETESLPVVLLVGSFEPFDENEAIRVRASTVMTKPFSSIRQLVNQVAELMDAAATTDELPDDPQADIETVVPNAEIPAEPAEELDDIESLYHQSLSNEPRPEDDPSIETIEFGDVGMDDELVEEHHPEGPETDTGSAETTEFTFADEADTAEDAGESTEPVSDEHFAEGAPDLAIEHDTLEFPTPEMQEPAAENAQPEAAQDEYAQHSSESAVPDSEPELGIAEEMAAEQDEYDLSELPTDEPVSGAEPTRYDTASLSEGPIDTTAAENALPTIEPDLETGPLEIEENLSRYEFDEIDLLDIPQAGDESTLEIVTPEQSVASGSPSKAVSLSPELIDLIVDRVVDRVVERLRGEG